MINKALHEKSRKNYFPNNIELKISFSTVDKKRREMKIKSFISLLL